MENRYKITLNGTDLDLEKTDEKIIVEKYDFAPEVIFNGKFYKVFVSGHEFKIEFKDNAIFLNGKEVDFDFRHSPTIQLKKGAQAKRQADIKAAIPGKIVDVKVNLGDIVNDQQCLLILESMKMRNEILSPMDGVVDKILVNTGDQVLARQLMIKIKPIKTEKE